MWRRFWHKLLASLVYAKAVKLSIKLVNDSIILFHVCMKDIKLHQRLDFSLLTFKDIKIMFFS